MQKERFDAPLALAFLKNSGLRFTRSQQRRHADGTSEWLVLLARTRPRTGPAAFGRGRHARSLQWRTRAGLAPTAMQALNEIVALGNRLVRPDSRFSWRVATFFTWEEKSQLLGDSPIDNLHEAVV